MRHLCPFLRLTSMDNLGIYIHIPFCLSKCRYCDFNSFAGKTHLQKDYLFALIKQIRGTADRCKGREVDTIYIGGGTPSCMFNGAIQTILAEVRKYYNIRDDAEISMEANPNSITMDKAIEWRNAGINRISVGLQTTRSSALQLIGRTHTKKDYVNAIHVLCDAGFNNINTDLMIGLPKQKSSDVRYSVDLCAKLGCKHISCYSLILEENTPLYAMVQEGKVKLPKEAKTIGMYNTAYTELTKLGYNRYEVSNFALDGYRCRHNLNCWNICEYFGFGAGACGYYDNVRYENTKSIEDYINKINNNVDPIVDYDKCDQSSNYEEMIMLGLRTTDGVTIDNLDKCLGCDFVEKYRDTIDKYQKLGLIEIVGGRLRVTSKGFFVLNQIILDFVM